MEWDVAADRFLVKADLKDVVAHHGNGVYTILVWSEPGGEDVVISEYSIFYGIEPPETYTP